MVEKTKVVDAQSTELGGSADLAPSHTTVSPIGFLRAPHKNPRLILSRHRRAHDGKSRESIWYMTRPVSTDLMRAILPKVYSMEVRQVASLPTALSI